MPFDRTAPLKVFDRLDLPEVVAFFERILSHYDASRVEWLKLTSLPRTRWSFKCDRPVRVRPRSREFEQGYRLRCGVNTKKRFPYADRIQIGWKEGEDGGEGMELLAAVTFASKAEVAVFGLGSAIYRFLRHSRQVPGRDINSRARKHGLYALAVFRTGLPFDPYEATDRLVARDALEEAGDGESMALLAEEPEQAAAG